MLQICGWQGDGQNGVRRNAAVQRGVENYFTDSLLYKENNKLIKKSLPNDIDSSNEADSESGEDPGVSFDKEPIVAYLNDPNCNNSSDNGDEWSLIKMSILIISCVAMM